MIIAIHLITLPKDFSLTANSGSKVLNSQALNQNKTTIHEKPKKCVNPLIYEKYKVHVNFNKKSNDQHRVTHCKPPSQTQPHINVLVLPKKYPYVDTYPFSPTNTNIVQCSLYHINIFTKHDIVHFKKVSPSTKSTCKILTKLNFFDDSFDVWIHINYLAKVYIISNESLFTIKKAQFANHHKQTKKIRKLKDSNNLTSTLISIAEIQKSSSRASIATDYTGHYQCHPHTKVMGDDLNTTSEEEYWEQTEESDNSVIAAKPKNPIVQPGTPTTVILSCLKDKFGTLLTPSNHHTPEKKNQTEESDCSVITANLVNLKVQSGTSTTVLSSCSKDKLGSLRTSSNHHISEKKNQQFTPIIEPPRTPKRKNSSPIAKIESKRRLLNPMAPPKFSEVVQKKLWVVDIMVDDGENEAMTRDQGKLIEEELTKALFASNDLEALEFDHCGYERNLYRTISSNVETRNWVVATIPGLKFESWPEAKLKIIETGETPKMVRASILLDYPTPDFGEVFSIIEARNRGINTKFWRVYKKNKVEKGKQLWNIGIDEESSKTIKNLGFFVQYGLKKLKISIPDGKPKK